VLSVTPWSDAVRRRRAVSSLDSAVRLVSGITGAGTRSAGPTSVASFRSASASRQAAAAPAWSCADSHAR
jgi:hypothetical protein